MFYCNNFYKKKFKHTVDFWVITCLFQNIYSHFLNFSFQPQASHIQAHMCTHMIHACRYMYMHRFANLHSLERTENRTREFFSKMEYYLLKILGVKKKPKSVLNLLRLRKVSSHQYLQDVSVCIIILSNAHNNAQHLF